MSCSRAMISATMSVALGACSTVGREAGAGDPFLGEAVKYNAAVQTINPDPVYTADMAKPGDNGEKGAAAVERYRTDQVKPIETIQTTAGTTDSSSGSTPPR